MGQSSEDNLWQDFCYRELIREIRRVKSMAEDLRDREYKNIVSFFKMKRIIPKLLTRRGNYELTYDLGHDDAFCQDTYIPRGEFDEHVRFINIAIARLYYRLASENKDFEFVRGA